MTTTGPRATVAAASATRARDQRALGRALVITAVYFCAELAAGIVTNSLALQSDAAHMFADVIALALGVFALWIAAHPATQTKTFGYYRAEILVALMNGVVLWLIVLIILWEAWRRFLAPPPVAGGGVLVVAAIGLVVNLIAARLLSGPATHNLNVRGALLHVTSDLLGSVGVLVSGVIIVTTGWLPVDPLVSVVIGLLILFSSWTLIREAVDILMEAVPRHIDLDDLRRVLEAVAGAMEVHDLHVWSLTTGRYALSAHAVVEDGAASDRILAEMTERLAEHFDVEHVTIQLEVRNRRLAEPAH
jgi:cobalt-zinc-cadmium efflux system protein